MHAEEQGYIKRVSKAPNPKGKWLVVNYLTPRVRSYWRNLQNDDQRGGIRK
jgi:hypothetical protein